VDLVQVLVVVAVLMVEWVEVAVELDGEELAVEDD
jgi:hypothetical protein